MRLSCTWMAHG